MSWLDKVVFFEFSYLVAVRAPVCIFGGSFLEYSNNYSNFLTTRLHLAPYDYISLILNICSKFLLAERYGRRIVPCFSPQRI